MMFRFMRSGAFGKGMVRSFPVRSQRRMVFRLPVGETGSGATFILNVVSALMPTESVRENEISITVKEDNYTNSLSVFTNLDEGESITGELLEPDRSGGNTASAGERNGLPQREPACPRWTVTSPRHWMLPATTAVADL